MSQIFLNGEIVDSGKALLNPFDRGFLYADGVFETLRISGFRPCLCDLHIARLRESAAFLGLTVPETDLRAAIERVARENNIADGACRVTLTRGIDAGGPRPAKVSAPTLMIAARTHTPDLAGRKAKGVHCATLPFPLRAEGLPLQAHKTLAYLPSVIALAHAGEGREPILETVGGALSEGATANLFWFSGDALFTPSMEAGCLAGIARALILRLRENVNEGLFPRSALRAADEAFLVNSVAGVIPVVTLDGQPIGNGSPGPGTAELSRLLEKRLSRPESGEAG